MAAAVKVPMQAWKATRARLNIFFFLLDSSFNCWFHLPSTEASCMDQPGPCWGLGRGRWCHGAAGDTPGAALTENWFRWCLFLLPPRRRTVSCPACSYCGCPTCDHGVGVAISITATWSRGGFTTVGLCCHSGIGTWRINRGSGVGTQEPSYPES